MTPPLRVLALASLLLGQPLATAAPRACLSECTPRIGIVSAFGAEAAILVKETRGARRWTINGNRFTTGTQRGNRVVVVHSGVSMINAAMTTQTLIDHFRIERLVMSGISGGIDPAHRVGDVLVPETWAMPMEVYWHHDSSLPAPCGTAGDLSCLGLRIARVDGKPIAPFTLPGGVATGLFMRENHATRSGGAAEGEYVFDYRVDPAMLEVARQMAPALATCGPRRRARAVPPTPSSASPPRRASSSAVAACQGRRFSPIPRTAATCSTSCAPRRSTWRPPRSPTSPTSTASRTSPFAA